jgi:hypothetical protein
MRISKRTIAAALAVPAMAAALGVSACGGVEGSAAAPASSGASSSTTVTLTTQTPFWTYGGAVLGGELPAGTQVRVYCDFANPGNEGVNLGGQMAPGATDVNVLPPNVPAVGAEVQLYGQVGPVVQTCQNPGGG